MKVNTKIRYGLRTMIEIAMNAGTTGLLQKEISERQGIPIKYLDKIIAELKAANLILNVNGKRSGYRLAQPANKITVYDIYKTFEGRVAVINCLYEDAEGNCCRNMECASQEFWHVLSTEMEATLHSKTLDKLVKRQMQLENENNAVMSYQI